MRRRDISKVLLATATASGASAFVPKTAAAATCPTSFFAQTPAEQSAGVTPTCLSYPPGDVRRYGAACDGSTNDSAAIGQALTCNPEVWITGTSVATGISLSTDGQCLYGVGRGSGIVTLSATSSTPCITLAGNRQVVQNLVMNGGSTPNDTNTNFVAIRVTGTRALVEGVTTVGDWCYGIDMQGALYSTVDKCNIEGFRKRAVNFNSGGDNRLLNSMIFDPSLAAPTDAHVYLSNTPSVVIRNNLITRSGASAGPAIAATASPNLFSNTGLTIVENTIDNGQNWGISVNGYWDVHIRDNWLAWGQSSSGTGQILLQNVEKLYVQDNDIYGALTTTSIGISVINSSFGEIAGNTIEYCNTGCQLQASNYLLVHHNVAGQLTGLPPTGTPLLIAFQGVSLPFNNWCMFWDNEIFQAQAANYGSGIDVRNIRDFNIFQANSSEGLAPISDNLYPLGTGSFRWSSVSASSYGLGPAVWLSSGNGSPNGVVGGSPGSLYVDVNGGANSTLWVKESGTGSTGWVAK